jgi:general secretion pathway protein D
MRQLLLRLLFASALVRAQDYSIADPKVLVWRAQELENAKKVPEAWLLYSQAAALDPKNAYAVGKATQLKTQALSAANIQARAESGKAEIDPDDPLISIRDEELVEAKQLAAPPALEPKGGPLTLSQTADAKTLYQRVFRHFGLEVIFDGDYDNPANRQVKLENASFDEAIYTMNLAANSFVMPIAANVAMVARDTDQKRREQERNVAITFPLPTAISSPEAQEIARAIQQTFELQRVSIDTTRNLMLVRDRWSKVRFAELALQQLLAYRGQVMIDIEFYEVNRQSNLSFGFSLPTATQLVPLLRHSFFRAPALSGARNLLTFGGGASLLGFGVTSASLFASMTYSHTSSLFQGQIRALDHLAATLHVGDKFPIVTSTASLLPGTDGGTGGAGLFPQIQFEDLGLTVKVTPHLHGNEEITLDIETEFKVLTGQTNNDIPVIANRKYTGTVRLKRGEWAVAAGLTTKNESRSRGGIVGLSQIPVLGAALSTNGRDLSEGQTLLVLRPHVISPPAAEMQTRAIFTGPEQRYLAPVR